MPNLPIVHLVMVSSIDGIIARNSNEFVDWSSREDKKYFSAITKEKGCLVMGSNTFKTIGRPLPRRHNLILTTKEEQMMEEYGADEIENLDFKKFESSKECLNYCSKLGYDEIVLGGGTGVNTMFLKENNINYIHLSVEPIVAGHGLKLFDTKLEKRLNLIENNQLNDNTVLLVYKVI